MHAAGKGLAAVAATVVLVAWLGPALAQRLPGASDAATAALARGEWPAYAGTNAAAKYSPLDQINASNVKNLQIAWRWTSPDHDLRFATPGIDPSVMHEATPLMIGGVLYTSTSLSQVAAIDAATGRTKWVFDPGVHVHGMPANLGWVHRGVAYWRAGDDERIVIATAHALLIALDAKTGKPIETFGDKGRVNLTDGLGRPVPFRFLYTNTSPPVIVGDVVVVGSSILDFPVVKAMPPGDVRGFDVRSGKQRWTFRAVPHPGEVGHETWESDAWRDTGNTNVWAPFSADDELGYVYLPFSTSANDYYGGDRPGDNLFAETLVCLDARTGMRVWHYQLVRHGVWDYDLPAAPNLIDVTLDGKRVKAVAQVTKQGFVFAFDRVTGAPLWPIEDRPVAASSVAGEKLALTQPYPTRPAPFEIQGIREADLIDFTPELRSQALEIIGKYDHGPLYTPPTERGTIVMPGVAGGASWSGAAWDPESETYYVTTFRAPFVVTLFQPTEVAARFAGRFDYLIGPNRLPLLKPPWGSVVAIDMSRGEHRWRAAVGTGPRNHPALALLNLTERLGWPTRSWALATRTLLFVVQMGYRGPAKPAPFSPRRRVNDLFNLEPKLYAYDKATGALLAETPLPANATGAPMTYMINGAQHIVVAVGGANLSEELIALRLP